MTKFSYIKLRTGRAFLYFISVFCLIWMSWNWVMWHEAPQFAFDERGYPLLTLILSVEASLAASLILASQQESDTRQKAWQEANAAKIEELLVSQRDQLGRMERADRHRAHMLEALATLVKERLGDGHGQ